MKIITSYNIRLKTEHISALKQTVMIYTDTIRYFIDVILQEWDNVKDLSSMSLVNCIESLTHSTEKNINPKYPDFDIKFPKLPCYLRRSAISSAFGKCKSYKSSLANWEKADMNTRGKATSMPYITYEMPAFYKGNMFERINDYDAKLKLFINNDWKYITVGLRKSDVDYIKHHCSFRTEMSPVLRHNHKVWELCFSFKEKRDLNDANIYNQRILAVDLGINNPCTCSIMTSDGTVLSRHFYKAPVEEDSLNHKLNKLKKSQQHGSRQTPKKWASVNGMNTMLSRKTAGFIINMAVLYNVDVIVMENLNITGKIHGSKKQRLSLWRKRAVQKQVTLQAHRLGIRIRRVCAKNTSKLAYDGSGEVLRGHDADLNTYSLCKFKTGKIYNCDLSASYNIGARYYIREILKSFSETERLSILAKVPECDKRSTCTLASLIRLNAVLAS